MWPDHAFECGAAALRGPKQGKSFASARGDRSQLRFRAASVGCRLLCRPFRRGVVLDTAPGAEVRTLFLLIQLLLGRLKVVTLLVIQLIAT